MKQLTETEMLWANFVKSVRANVRLKYSLRADRELNQVLPELEKRFMAAVKAGKEQELVVDEAANVVLELGSGS